MRSFKILPLVVVMMPSIILPDALIAGEYAVAPEQQSVGCLSQDDGGGRMQFDALIEGFAEALRIADAQGVRACLQRYPDLAAATLPSGWPVFLEQSVFPDPDIIDLMIAAGADPDARSPSGETLLHLSADPIAIARLLFHGADINASDHQGYTPMMAHAVHPETGPDAIYTLFAAGADPDLIGLDGKTVFDLLPQGARFDRLRQHMRDQDQTR